MLRPLSDALIAEVATGNSTARQQLAQILTPGLIFFLERRRQEARGTAELLVENLIAQIQANRLCTVAQVVNEALSVVRRTYVEDSAPAVPADGRQIAPPALERDREILHRYYVLKQSVARIAFDLGLDERFIEASKSILRNHLRENTKDLLDPDDPNVRAANAG